MFSTHHARPAMSANTSVPACPPADDYVVVPRASLSRLHAHLAAEHERFPARRLRQAIQIVRRMLGGDDRTAV